MKDEFDRTTRFVGTIGCMIFLAYFSLWVFALWLAYKVVMHFIS